ncbi:hypothetical protein HAZT_HAZT011512, partial [Hyalella azteca]
MMDEAVSVVISGLDSNEVYTLHSSITDCKGVPFAAVAHYRSNNSGVIDLKNTPALGGHYTGVFPMAPFVCILPMSTKLKDPRMSMHDITSPLKYNLSVFEGAYGYHLLVKGAEFLGLEPVCETVHERRLMGDGCQRIPVRHGRVRGALHLPPGDGPFPGVVDMFGSAGGLMEHRASLLAARGVATLALAFFDYDDLPQTLDSLDLEYFIEAVSKEGVGVIGTSKGGDIALDLAMVSPKVKVIVPINGSCYSIQASMNLGGKPIRPPLPFTIEEGQIQRDLRLNLSRIFDGKNCPESIVPVEKVPCHMLWIVSEDDQNWTSEKFADIAYQRYAQHNPHTLEKFQVLKYPGAGHLVEPPYVPFCEMSYHRVVTSSMIWGGNALDHTHAQ